MLLLYKINSQQNSVSLIPDVIYYVIIVTIKSNVYHTSWSEL